MTRRQHKKRTSPLPQRSRAGKSAAGMRDVNDSHYVIGGAAFGGEPRRLSRRFISALSSCRHSRSGRVSTLPLSTNGRFICVGSCSIDSNPLLFGLLPPTV